MAAALAWSFPKYGQDGVTELFQQDSARAQQSIVITNLKNVVPRQLGRTTGGFHPMPHLSLPKRYRFRGAVVGPASDLQQCEPAKFIPNGSVALAGGILQYSTVLNRHHSARVVDQASAVEEPCCQGHGRARCA